MQVDPNRLMVMGSLRQHLPRICANHSQTRYATIAEDHGPTRVVEPADQLEARVANHVKSWVIFPEFVILPGRLFVQYARTLTLTVTSTLSQLGHQVELSSHLK